MNDVAWFWLTVIVLIISLSVKCSLSDYFKYKYGKEAKNETDSIIHPADEAPARVGCRYE